MFSRLEGTLKKGIALLELHHVEVLPILRSMSSHIRKYGRIATWRATSQHESTTELGEHMLSPRGMRAS